MEKVHSEVYCVEKIRKISVVITFVLLIVLTTACGKNYSDYSNVWVSEDQSVCIEPDGIAHLNYEEIDSHTVYDYLSSGTDGLRKRGGAVRVSAAEGGQRTAACGRDGPLSLLTVYG